MQTPKKWTSQGLQSQDKSPSNSHPTNLIINYLPWDILDEELYDMFSTFGEIRRCKVVRDSPGHCAGYGFVNFVSPRAASVAQILLNAREIRGKRLKVAFAKPPSKDIAKANLYVKCLPPRVDEAELEALFGSYGKIAAVKIVRDTRVDGAPLNMAYVRFEQHLDAQKARSDLDGYIFTGAKQPISVQTARGSNREASELDRAQAMEEPPLSPSPPPKIQAEASQRPRGFIFEDLDQDFAIEEGLWAPPPPQSSQAETPKRPCGFIFADSESD